MWLVNTIDICDYPNKNHHQFIDLDKCTIHERNAGIYIVYKKHGFWIKRKYESIASRSLSEFKIRLDMEGKHVVSKNQSS